MPLLTIRTPHDLHTRRSAVTKILRPIARHSVGPALDTKSSTSVIVLAAHDGSPPRSEYRSWRFATTAPGFSAMYHERWERANHHVWRLERAYLHLYKRDGLDETEFLCLHCDPTEAVTAPHAPYKQGPHLHISIAGDEIRHAHLAVHGGFLSVVLANVAAFNRAMGWAIQMLRDEVLDPLL
jgi:hypothetical protein